MDFETTNVIDINYRKNEYAEIFKEILLKNKPQNVKKRIYDFFKSNKNDDILDMKILALNSSISKKGKNLFLFFGIEDVIGFSDYIDLSAAKSLEYLEKSVFTITTVKTRAIYLNNKRSINLYNKLNPYFYLGNKLGDFTWLKDNKNLKVKGLFIGKNLKFTSIEAEWLREKYKKILIDRNFFKSDIFDKNDFDIIEFDSSKTTNFYSGIM